jgi:DMSO/TMAO reductase YedYZ molybdopterin-dependent catalytic subunit
VKRRGFIAGLLAGAVAGCTQVGKSDTAKTVFAAANDWHRKLHDLLGRRSAPAPEYPVSAISPVFRGNGSRTVDTDAYRAALAAGFPDWTLSVTGLVERPISLTLDQIRALPQRTQITRHDCVEGWSAIGQWTGPQLAYLLELAGLREEARFIVFRCADTLSGARYYESVDLIDAFHPQTIVAHALNGEPLPEKNGAPLRMRIERQLGYKHAKYLTGIEAVASLDDVEGGKGGYWEDRSGYQWYAGI